MTDSQLPQRILVWLACSEFYLDTELNEEQISEIVQILKASGFLLEEIEEINLNEVAPVLARNLQQVAGDWQGFEEDWLIANITERLNRPFWLRRIENNLFRSYRKNLTAKYWKLIEAAW